METFPHVDPTSWTPREETDSQTDRKTYTYRQTDRDTKRETRIQIERERDSERERERWCEREKEREKRDRERGERRERRDREKREKREQSADMYICPPPCLNTSLSTKCSFLSSVDSFALVFDQISSSEILKSEELVHINVNSSVDLAIASKRSVLCPILP